LLLLMLLQWFVSRSAAVLAPSTARVLVLVLWQSDALMLSTPLTIAILVGAAAVVLLLVAVIVANSALGVAEAIEAAFAAAFAVRRLCLPAAARNFAVASALLQFARPAEDDLTAAADADGAVGADAGCISVVAAAAFEDAAALLGSIVVSLC
jgi:hypothetical protein